MMFKDKYTIDKEKEPEKKQISKESYAVCELLELILKKLTKRLI